MLGCQPIFTSSHDKAGLVFAQHLISVFYIRTAYGAEEIKMPRIYVEVYSIKNFNRNDKFGLKDIDSVIKVV